MLAPDTPLPAKWGAPGRGVPANTLQQLFPRSPVQKGANSATKQLLRQP